MNQHIWIETLSTYGSGTNQLLDLNLNGRVITCSLVPSNSLRWLVGMDTYLIRQVESVAVNSQREQAS